jgi:TrpR-related protein YerC/YecD
MQQTSATIWDISTCKQLASALLSIDDAQTMQSFLRDVMTEKEIIEISARLEAAKMLKAGNKYTDIVAKTKLSSRTVARISDWIKNGNGGYAKVIDQTSHNAHIPPASAA